MQSELFQIEKTFQKGLPFIGCAGWGLSSANKHLFPDNGSHLERYAAVFPGVEINTSFYRLHRADSYARWRDSVPDDFRFSVKLLRTITHEKRLRDCDQDLQQFVETVRPLGNKWGCLLVQFPPSCAYPGATARHFFSLLRDLVDVDIACEPRHPSWFQSEVIEQMASSGIAYVDADPPVMRGIKPVDSPKLVQYIRLHGSPIVYHSRYSEAYIDQLASRLSAACASGQRSWCVFDNTASGAAIDNAYSLLAKMHLIDALNASPLAKS